MHLDASGAPPLPHVRNPGYSDMPGLLDSLGAYPHKSEMPSPLTRTRILTAMQDRIASISGKDSEAWREATVAPYLRGG